MFNIGPNASGNQLLDIEKISNKRKREQMESTDEPPHKRNKLSNSNGLIATQTLIQRIGCLAKLWGYPIKNIHETRDGKLRIYSTSKLYHAGARDKFIKNMLKAPVDASNNIDYFDVSINHLQLNSLIQCDPRHLICFTTEPHYLFGSKLTELEPDEVSKYKIYLHVGIHRHVGGALINPRKNDDNIIQLDFFVIDDQHQNKGYGTLLMVQVLEQCFLHDAGLIFDVADRYRDDGDDGVEKDPLIFYQKFFERRFIQYESQESESSAGVQCTLSVSTQEIKNYKARTAQYRTFNDHSPTFFSIRNNATIPPPNSHQTNAFHQQRPNSGVPRSFCFT